MILIIEGSDLSGKTYAIEKIAKHFNSGFVLKNAYKPKEARDSGKIYAQYYSIIDVVDLYRMSRKNDLVILDRFFPSQAVYSYLRGKDEMYDSCVKKLDDECAASGWKYLYLDTPLKVLNERYDIRGDEHIKKEMLTKLKHRYDEFYQRTVMVKCKINTLEKDWLQQVIKFVEEK